MSGNTVYFRYGYLTSIEFKTHVWQWEKRSDPVITSGPFRSNPVITLTLVVCWRGWNWMKRHPTIITTQRQGFPESVCLLDVWKHIVCFVCKAFSHVSIHVCGMSEAAFISHTIAKPFLFTMLCQYCVTLSTGRPCIFMPSHSTFSFIDDFLTDQIPVILWFCGHHEARLRQLKKQWPSPGTWKFLKIVLFMLWIVCSPVKSWRFYSVLHSRNCQDDGDSWRKWMTYFCRLKSFLMKNNGQVR